MRARKRTVPACLRPGLQVQEGDPGWGGSGTQGARLLCCLGPISCFRAVPGPVLVSAASSLSRRKHSSSERPLRCPPQHFFSGPLRGVPVHRPHWPPGRLDSVAGEGSVHTRAPFGKAGPGPLPASSSLSPQPRSGLSPPPRPRWTLIGRARCVEMEADSQWGSDAGVGAPHGLQPGTPGRLPPELSETSGAVPAPRAGAQRCFPGERQAAAQAPPRHRRTDLAWRRAAGWLCGRKNLPALVSGAVLPKELDLLGLANLYARGRP